MPASNDAFFSLYIFKKKKREASPSGRGVSQRLTERVLYGKILRPSREPIFYRIEEEFMIIKNDENMIDINEGLRLIEKRSGLTFGTDAYLLSAYVRGSGRSVCVDLGSGTGVISLLMLSKKKAARIHAVELQAEFAELIERNGELNGLSDRLCVHASDVRDLKDTDFPETVDTVVSNPPYMKCSGKANESDYKNIARHETAGSIGDFCSAAGRILKHGGLFYVVFRPDRMTELMTALTEAKLEPKRITFVHARAELPPCLMLCEAKKGASHGCYVTPPLIMYKEGSTYTDELTRIYERGEFDEHYQRP